MERYARLFFKEISLFTEKIIKTYPIEVRFLA
jgi:hypothetical protein